MTVPTADLPTERHLRARRHPRRFGCKTGQNQIPGPRAVAGETRHGKPEEREFFCVLFPVSLTSIPITSFGFNLRFFQ